MTAGTHHPATTEPTWLRLSPLALWAQAGALAAGAGALALTGTVAAVLFGAPLLVTALVPTGTVLVGAALVGAEALRFRAVRYRTTDERLELRSGVLATSHRSVPRERIRNVDVSTPIWLRPFGLCALTVGTGHNVGAHEDELRLSPLPTAEADRLRRELLRRGGPAPGPGADGATGEPETGTRLARLNPAWLGYGALTATGPVLGFGAVGGCYQVYGWFDQQGANRTAVEVYGHLLDRGVLAVAGALLAVLVAGAVAALALHVETWWGYRLDRETDGTLRVRRGLLTTTSLSIEERRMRGVELREPLPVRWFGAAAVRAVASGLGTGDGKELVARNAVTPLMPRGAATRTAADVLDGRGTPAAGPLRAHPRAALRRRLLQALAAAAGVAAGGTVLTAFVPWPPLPGWAGAVVGLAVTPPLVWYAVGCYRALGHTLTPRFVLVRQGMATRRTVALERCGVIGWRVTRSPFQRRAGLVTLRATTAAGPGVYTAPDMGLDQAIGFADEAVPGLLTRFLEPA